MTRFSNQWRKPSGKGYAYLEVLIAVMLISISLAPMIEALTNGVNHRGIAETMSINVENARSRLATLMTMDYDELDAQALADSNAVTALSDPEGTDGRVLVHLVRFDRDNADTDSNPLTGGDPGMLWLRVRSEGGAIDYQTLRARR